MDKKVAIVLINYHDYAERFLSDCRDSLRAQSYKNFQVYIVDNDYSEASLNYLKENYKEAKLLSREDGNYAAAENLGFKQAIEDGADYLVALNMDTVAEVNYLQELVTALELNPQAGMAQSKILLQPKDDKEKAEPRINSTGNIFHFLGFGFTQDYNKKDKEIAGYPLIRGYVSGCSFIIRQEIFSQVGGLNEDFYMYHDDIELSLKVKLAGHELILAPRSRVFHKYEFSRSIKMFYYMERNRHLLLFIFAPLRYLLLISPLLLLMDISMLVFSLFNASTSQVLKAYLYFFKPLNINRIKQARKLMKDTKKRFVELAPDFQSKIKFQEIDNPLLKYVANPLMSCYWFIIKRFI